MNRKLTVKLLWLVCVLCRCRVMFYCGILKKKINQTLVPAQIQGINVFNLGFNFFQFVSWSSPIEIW